MRYFYKFLTSVALIFFVVIVVTVVHATILSMLIAAKAQPYFNSSSIATICSNELAGIKMIIQDEYELNFVEVENYSNKYTSGIFGTETQKSLIILREATHNYTLIVGEFNSDFGSSYCILGGFRPFNSEDTV